MSKSIFLRNFSGVPRFSAGFEGSLSRRLARPKQPAHLQQATDGVSSCTLPLGAKCRGNGSSKTVPCSSWTTEHMKFRSFPMANFYGSQSRLRLRSVWLKASHVVSPDVRGVSGLRQFWLSGGGPRSGSLWLLREDSRESRRNGPRSTRGFCSEVGEAKGEERLFSPHVEKRERRLAVLPRLTVVQERFFCVRSSSLCGNDFCFETGAFFSPTRPSC